MASAIAGQDANRETQRGFTLLELVVALAIFALLGVGAYRVLSGALVANDRAAARDDEFRRLQKAVRTLEADLAQTVERSVRGDYGDAEPVFVGTADSLTLTRAGWPNPWGAKRSTLQRVDYHIGTDADGADGAAQTGDAKTAARTGAEVGTRADSQVFLIRRFWRVLDRAPDSASSRAALLPVDRLGLRYLDSAGQWLQQWPPVGQSGVAQALPAVVEVTIDTPAFGEIRRLLAVRDMKSANTTVNANAHANAKP